MQNDKIKIEMLAKFIDSETKKLKIDISELAKSVSQVIKQSYGKHNYSEFLETIKSELK